MKNTVKREYTVYYAIIFIILSLKEIIRLHIILDEGDKYVERREYDKM